MDALQLQFILTLLLALFLVLNSQVFIWYGKGYQKHIVIEPLEKALDFNRLPLGQRLKKNWRMALVGGLGGGLIGILIIYFGISRQALNNALIIPLLFAVSHTSMVLLTYWYAARNPASLSGSAHISKQLYNNQVLYQWTTGTMLIGALALLTNNHPFLMHGFIGMVIFTLIMWATKRFMPQ